MKVTCEYCDSVVDAENNDTCPNCGAPLANSRKAREAELNEERLKKEAEEHLSQLNEAIPEEKKKIDFYKSIIMIADGMMTLGRR